MPAERAKATEPCANVVSQACTATCGIVQGAPTRKAKTTLLELRLYLCIQCRYAHTKQMLICTSIYIHTNLRMYAHSYNMFSAYGRHTCKCATIKYTHYMCVCIVYTYIHTYLHPCMHTYIHNYLLTYQLYRCYIICVVLYVKYKHLACYLNTLCSGGPVPSPG